jgi:hypothetical protein
MVATSGGIAVPGGGTFEIVVLVVSRTSLPMVVICVPLTVKMPPRGAFGGIVLSEALAASAINAARVFPEVGLKHFA